MSFGINLETYAQHYQFIAFIVLLVVGLVVGTVLEKRHLKAIKAREKFFYQLPTVTMSLEKFLPQSQWHQVERAELVVGSVVMAPDYFRIIMAGIINILGGKVTVFESTLDRGRREAILRMKEAAPMADLVVNTRLEMACMKIGHGKVHVQPLCLYAYGTAIRLKKKAPPKETEHIWTDAETR